MDYESDKLHEIEKVVFDASIWLKGLHGFSEEDRQEAYNDALFDVLNSGLKGIDWANPEHMAYIRTRAKWRIIDSLRAKQDMFFPLSYNGDGCQVMAHIQEDGGMVTELPKKFNLNLLWSHLSTLEMIMCRQKADGMTQEEIAADWGYSTGKVSNVLRSAKEKIGKALTHEHKGGR